MITGDFVVADDFVIPVDDVETAIRSHRHSNRTEEGVVASNEVVELLESIARTIAVLTDGVYFRGDRVSDIHHAVITLRPDASVRKRQATEARATHLEVRSLDRELRLIGFSQAVGTTGIEPVLMERHHRVAVVVSLLDERFAFAGQHESPDIARANARRLEEATVRAEASHPRAREIGDITLGRGDLTRVEGALSEPEPTPRGAGELVRKEVGVLDAETRQQHLALVGFAVTVGVAKEDDFVAVLHDGAILIRQDAFGNGQPVGESTRLTRTGSEGLVEDDHLVTGLGLIEGLRGGRVLIGVDWVFQRGTGPGPALLVEDQHDELTEVGRLLSEKFDLEALGEFEELLLLLGRTADALHVVIACVALRRSDRGLLFHRLHLVPSERTRGSRQFLDRDILGLDHRHATGMNLDGDLAVGRDVRLGLNVIECRHAVNPAADTGAFGEDAVLVPLAFLHGGEHAGGVFRFGDYFIAAALVVDLAVPALAVVHLIAAHLRAIRHTHAAHLDPAINETRAGQA